MSKPLPLPLLTSAPVERRDAARNREALLEAAAELVGRCGVHALTMDALATKAGVGKGTVFRRFGNREGLMASLLNHREARKGKPTPSDHAPLLLDLDDPGQPLDAGWAEAEARIAARRTR